MFDIDRLHDDFIREHKAGGKADPREYLQRVDGTDRAELALLIDGYLARAEPQPEAVESAEYADQLASRVVEALAPSLTGVSGLWPTELPRLRDRARIKRADLVAQLAKALGVGEREEKVADYYNRMEQGRLPAEGVSSRVLDALGAIVGESADRLRAWGTALSSGAARALDDSDASAAFARVATVDALQSPTVARGLQQSEPDEVDELFTNGDS